MPVPHAKEAKSMTTQLAPNPASSLQLSAPVPLNFKWERFSAIARELPPLFALHSEELGEEADPNWESYLRLDNAEVLYVLTSRAAGALVGYIIFMVTPSLHQRSLKVAIEDIYFLKKEFRKGWSAMRMFKKAELGLQKIGVGKVILSQSTKFEGFERFDSFFKRLGFKYSGKIYSKVLTCVI